MNVYDSPGILDALFKFIIVVILISFATGVVSGLIDGDGDKGVKRGFMILKWEYEQLIKYGRPVLKYLLQQLSRFFHWLSTLLN